MNHPNSFKPPIGSQLAVRSPISHQEKERLIVAILRDPTACALAMDHLPPDTFGNALEPHYEVLLAALYELIRDCGYAPGKVPHPALVGAINDKIEHGYYLVAPEYPSWPISIARSPTRRLSCRSDTTGYQP